MPQLQAYVPRKLGSVTYGGAGAKNTLEIDRDGVLFGLMLRLRFTVTNGGSAAVGPLFQTLATLLKRVEVIVQGRDTVVSIDGPGLATRAMFEFGTQPQGMTDTVVLTGSAVTAYDVTLPLPFFLPRGRRPDDTALDLRAVTSCTLAITWGAIGDFYRTVNSAAFSGVSLDVTGLYMRDVDPAAVFMVRELSMTDKDLPGTNSNFDILLDRGEGVFYRSFLIAALVDSGSNSQYSGNNSILSAGSIKLIAGSNVFQHWDAPVLIGSNKLDYQAESLITGAYYLSTMLFGEGKTWINTDPNVLTADLKLVFDATKQTGQNLIRVYREAIRKLRV